MLSGAQAFEKGLQWKIGVGDLSNFGQLSGLALFS